MQRHIIIAALATILSLCSLDAAADVCGWECILPGDPCPEYIWVCRPEYGVVMTTEPDWCLYVQGDRVYLRYSGVTVTGWYVLDQCDATPPPMDFDQNPWWVEPGCLISPYAYCYP